MEIRKKLKNFSEYLIKNSQNINGLFPASPYPGNYNAYWLRDSVYLAESVKNKNVKKRYYKGFLKQMKKVENKIDKIIKEEKRHDDHWYIDPKFMVNGERIIGKGYDLENWGFVQHDAVALNVSKLIEYDQKEKILNNKEREMVKKLGRYLKNCWRFHPEDNSVWEEDKKIHSVSVGFMADALMKMRDYFGLDEFENEIDDMMKFIKRERVTNGYLIDFFWEPEYGDKKEGERIDFNTLMFSYPLNFFERGYISYNVLKDTVEKIEEKLVKSYGVKRYEEDQYKGGGEWLIGNQFLSLSYINLFKRFKKEKYLEKANYYIYKTEISTTYRLELPEQIVRDDLNEKLILLPNIGKYGVRKQTPLLWSHAMYLLNLKKLEDVENG